LGKSLEGLYICRATSCKIWQSNLACSVGGCKLGIRSIATHVNGFNDLGVKYSYEDGVINLEYKPKGVLKKSIWLMEASVTATINIAIFVSAIESEVEIIDAACEPHVVDVLNTLVKMGAKIEGIGTNRLL